MKVKGTPLVTLSSAHIGMPRGDAHAQVSVILPVKSARGLVYVVAQQGSEMVGGDLGRRLDKQVEGSPLVHPRVVVARRVRTR